MKCIFCDVELYADESYVTDGKICVCNMCASRHSLYETAVFISNRSVDSYLMRHDSDMLVIDDGLTSQTADGDNEIADDIENMSHEDFFSKYADDPDALSAYIDANGEPDDGLTSQTAEEYAESSVPEVESV